MELLELRLLFFNILIIFFFEIGEGMDAEGIMGGDVAQVDQFKYQVSLQNQKGITFCSAGIIGDKHILTAAHCVVTSAGTFKNIDAVAVFGAVNLTDTDDYVIKIPVKKIYVPKEFRPFHSVRVKLYRTPGDIAVIMLEHGLQLDENPRLSKLELPSKLAPSYVDENVVVAGFGHTWMITSQDFFTRILREIKSGTDNELRFAEAVVIPNDKCNKTVNQPVYASQICAKVVQRDAKHPEGVCNGDSGGPLVHNGKTVIGVLSTSPKGCTESYGSGVYTRVSSYLRFINDALEDKNTPEMRTWYYENNTQNFGVYNEYWS